MFQPSKHVREQQQLEAGGAVGQQSNAPVDAPASSASTSASISSLVVPLSPSRSFLHPPSDARRGSRSSDSDDGFVLISPRAHLPDSNLRAHQLEGAASGAARQSTLRSPVHSRSSSTRIFSGAPTLVLPPESISPFSPLYPSPSSATGAQWQAAALAPLHPPLQSPRPLQLCRQTDSLGIPALFRGATDFAMGGMPGASPVPGASPRAHAARSHARTSPQPAPTESIDAWMKVAVKPAATPPVAYIQAPFRPAPSCPHEDHEEEDEQSAVHDQWAVSALAHRGGGKARLRVSGGSGVNEAKAYKRKNAKLRQLQEQPQAYVEDEAAEDVAPSFKRVQQRERAQRQRETQQAVARARDLTHSVRQLTPASNELESQSEVAWSQSQSQAQSQSQSLVADPEDPYDRWLRAWNERVSRGEVHDARRTQTATGAVSESAALRHLREMDEDELAHYLEYLTLADEHARHVDLQLRDDDEDADEAPPADADLHAHARDRPPPVVRLADPRSRAQALAAPFDVTPLHARAHPAVGVGAGASGSVSALLRPDVSGGSGRGPFQRVWAKHHMVMNLTANKKCKRLYNHPVKPKSARQMETLNNRRNTRTDAHMLHELRDDRDDDERQ